jgi:hypothetical protein
LTWVRESRERGRHRTEVTEVTEGEGNFLPGDTVGLRAKYAKRKASMISRFAAPEVAVFTKTVFNGPPNFPLCDLCAMLSPLRVTPARKPRTGSRCCKAFFPARKPPRTKTVFNGPPNFPLCDLCGLCAMLSPLRVAPHWESVLRAFRRSFPPGAAVSTKQFSPRTFFLTEAWEKVHQSLVHSQSTILGSHKASLVSHRGLNLLKRIGGTGQETGIFKR